MESHCKDDSLLFADVSYTEPAAWFHLTGNAPPKKTALVDSSPVAFADIEVTRETARFKGWRESSIEHHSQKRNQTPTAIIRCCFTGYGGYGVSMQP